MSFEKQQLKKIIEAALMASGQTLSIDQIMVLFLDDQQPTRDEVKEALKEIADECESRGIELKQVSSGYRFQARQEFAPWISRLWEEKPPRYSRALLETLVLIAYRQPITRGEIEDVRGVTVSSQIIKTLLEREWVKVVGHRDVPGKPALYATTKDFLDYFNLKSLEDLPTLAEIRDLDKINAELALDDPEFEQPEQDLDKMMGEENELETDSEAVTDETSAEKTEMADAETAESEASEAETSEIVTSEATLHAEEDFHELDEGQIDAEEEIVDESVEADKLSDAEQDYHEDEVQEDETQEEDSEDMLYASDDDSVSMHDAQDSETTRNMIEPEDEPVKAVTDDDSVIVLNT